MKRSAIDITPLATSYEMGLKRVLLSANESGCSITQVAILELKAGDRSAKHIHPDLQDLFFVLEGEIEITIDGKKNRCTKEDFIFVEHLKSYELHAITDVRMLAMGCVIETQRTKLYPMLFEPNLHTKVWGSIDLTAWKELPRQDHIGESWEVSTLDMLPSVIANGTWAGYPLSEVIAKMPEAILGKAVAKKYHNQMPLLVKFIDTKADLSVQVHPDDAMALREHNGSGKTEMWYIMDAEPDALLYIGFKNPNITREEYIDAVAKGTVAEIIEPVTVKAGDAFLIPSGTVHSISGGVSLVEIQQPVDLTYRIFDWNRVDSDGNSRELHTAYAVDAIDFSSNVNVCRREYKAVVNSAVEIARSDYFTCNILKVEGATERNLGSLDSFVLYYCTEGSVEIITDDGSETLRKGEVVLIPAEANEITINGSATLLEYYVD